MSRPQFLGGQHRKPKRSLLGDLLGRLGFARRPVTTAQALGQSNVVRLADVDRRAAELMRRRDALSKRHAAGAKAAQEALTARVHEHLERGRGHA